MADVDLILYIHHETPDAVLVSEDGTEADAVWLPKRFAERGERRSKSDPIFEFSVAEWLAQREGLI
jgi:hypothetical protein